jgi:hypothetical protein
MPIFGITASSNMSTKLTDFYQIATTTLANSTTNTVTFSSIPQDYTHLQIRGIGRITQASSDTNIYIRFNSDSGTNYSAHYLYGTGASALSGGGANELVTIPFRVTGANSTANIFGVGVVDILDYANTNKFKTMRSITGHDQNGAGAAWFFSNNWRSTSAITSITFTPDGGNFAQYTSFALYGIKG